MDSPERSRGYGKKDVEDYVDGKRDDDEEWEGNGKRKHRLSKSRKSGDVEDFDGRDSGGRRKSTGDRNEGGRRVPASGGSSKVVNEEDEYDWEKDSGSKQGKKKQETSALEKLSEYHDGDFENRHDGGDKYGSRSYSRSDDNERNASRKTSSKFSDHEGSHRRSKSKDYRTRDGDDEKALSNSNYSERRESNREKGHGFSEVVKDRRRWEESEGSVKPEDSSHVGKSEPKSRSGFDSKHETSRERSTSSRVDTCELKDTVVDSVADKGKSYSKEERKVESSDRSKGRSRSDVAEEDDSSGLALQEDRSSRGKSEKNREPKNPGCDAMDTQDKLPNPEEDTNPWPRDKTSRESELPRKSRSPERSGRRCRELENSEVDYESSGSKRKDLERDGFRDDKIRGRENSWGDRSREREDSRDNWKRRQQGSSNDRDVDLAHDRDRDREFPRRGRDRMDSERHFGRFGNRKDGRSEAVKASSSFGISTENYDVIEIQPKPLEYGRDDPASPFSRRTEAVALHDPKSAPHDDWVRSQGDRIDGVVHPTTGDDSSVKLVDHQSSFSTRPSTGVGSQPPHSSRDPGDFGRVQQGVKGGNRLGRGGRVRPPGRDNNQQVNIPVPIMGSPFGHLGMPPPGPMQPMNPGMSPGPGPGPGPPVFVTPFPPPVWAGGQGVEMGMLPVSPGVSSLPPPGPHGQRFSPNMGAPPNPALYFNQPGQGRAVPIPNGSGPGFNANVSVSRGNSNDKSKMSGGGSGKAPSRGEQNDYSQNFVDTGMRPQNFIRELELANVEDYPKLRELIQKKDEIVCKAATPPVYQKCDLRDFVLSPEFFGTKFDVILVDPPWEEYVHRAPGVTDHMECWTFEEIMNLKIEAIADTPSFIFLWVGDGIGLEQGRQCLKKWGFRRCEDICWVKTNKHTATPTLRHDSHTLFQHSKEHCLMGIKGTVRRSTDGHIIHANIDTDVIIAEEPPYGSTAKPDEMYRIIEHFALGRRRIELFGEDHNIRAGWLTVGKGLSSSNFNTEAFVKSFADKDGKVWQGGGGRNPPPDAPHLVQTTPEIESLRPKSPMKNQQQLQQQSNSISLTTANSSSRRPSGNSPQNPTTFVVNQEASSSNHPPSWASPMEGFKGPNDNVFDMYGFNMHPVPPNGEYLDFESQRMMNML